MKIKQYKKTLQGLSKKQEEELAIAQQKYIMTALDFFNKNYPREKLDLSQQNTAVLGAARDPLIQDAFAEYDLCRSIYSDIKSALLAVEVCQAQYLSFKYTENGYSTGYSTPLVAIRYERIKTYIETKELAIRDIKRENTSRREVDILNQLYRTRDCD